jgi:hypothetical protein
MKASAGVLGFFNGVGMASIALGGSLGVIWVLLWALAAAGGPDWRMPLQILQSAGMMVLLGWVIRLLLRATSTKEAT